MVKEPHKAWYIISPEKVLSELETSLNGLSEGTAEARLKQYGPNQIRSGRELSPWTILWHLAELYQGPRLRLESICTRTAMSSSLAVAIFGSPV